ncbi:MAG TPA: gluconokinase [Armatimonadota bacterium]|nr:gluconokinase [Armatimonadota bacterium]
MTAPGVVAALDIGTSSVRAILFDTRGFPVPGAAARRPHHPQTGSDGAATLDPDALVDAAVSCLAEAINHAPGPLLGVASATFWHSFLGLNREGRACTPVYLWSDTRSFGQVETLRRRLDEREVHARTGCRFHTSYLPARLLWLRETDPALFRKVTAWVSPGEYLCLKLFGERRCSFSMASGTGLLNQRSLVWDAELLEALEVPVERLSPLTDEHEVLSQMRAPYASMLPALAAIPWLLPLGDGACSNVGSGGVGPDRVTLMVGTSGAMRILGAPVDAAPWGLWKYRLDRRRSLVGGALSNGGGVYRWMNDVLKLPPLEQLEQFVASAEPDSHGLTVLPFLWGERSPDWYSHATGAILGLTAATRSEEIAQALLEAVAYRFMLVYRLLMALAPPDRRLIGSGAALGHSRALAQMLADALGAPLTLTLEAEGTARGAALMMLEQIAALQIDAAPLDEGETLFPDAARHERYERGLERHVAMAERFLMKETNA